MRYILRVILFLFMSVISLESQAYVECSLKVTDVASTSTSGFHKFSELGYSGSVVFVNIPASACSFRSGDTYTAGSAIFMVIDGMDAASDIKKTWASMLVTAQAAGKTILIHARNEGTNSNNLQLLTPYFMSLRN